MTLFGVSDNEDCLTLAEHFHRLYWERLTKNDDQIYGSKNEGMNVEADTLESKVPQVIHWTTSLPLVKVC